MTTPAFDAHTHSVRCDPSLIGSLPNGDLIDLDGGKIEFVPYQTLEWSMDRTAKPWVSEGWREYHLSFIKRSGSPWIKWFNDNSDVRFKVAGLTFAIDSMVAAPTDHEMTYTARSIL